MPTTDDVAEMLSISPGDLVVLSENFMTDPFWGIGLVVAADEFKVDVLWSNIKTSGCKVFSHSHFKLRKVQTGRNAC